MIDLADLVLSTMESLRGPRRQDMLRRLAQGLKSRGSTPGEVIAAVRDANTMCCSPSLPESQVWALAEAVFPRLRADPAVERMNKEHAVVADCGRTMVITERDDDVLGRRVRSRSSFQDIRNKAALDHFDESRGFMLLVESASIDKQSHFRRPCGHIGEVGQLDEALGVALEYSVAHPETLILVTADHTHAAHIIAETSELLALNYASPGYVARILTPEGGIMGINYATTNAPIMEMHTGGQVPVFASGPGIDALPSFMTQADIYHISARHLGIFAEHP